MSFITKQGLALAILSIALVMPGFAKVVSYEVQLEVPKSYRSYCRIISTSINGATTRI